MSEYTKIALEVITCFDKAVKDLLGRVYKSKAITSRLNDFPGLAATSGIMPALTYYLSKAAEEEKIFETTYWLIKNRRCKFPEKDRSMIVGSLKDIEGNRGEGKGYGIALALLIASLESVGFLTINGESPGLREVADALLQTLNSGSGVPEMEALEVITELKKLGTAFYKP